MKRLKRIGSELLAAGLVVLGLGLLQKTFAATQEAMQFSVTPIGCTYAVALASPTAGSAYNFGNVSIGGTTVSTNAIVLTNTAATCGQFYVFKVADTSGSAWTIGGAPDVDTFRLRVAVQSGQPSALTTAPYDVAGSYGGSGANNYGQGATAIPPSTPKNVWMQFEMPTALSGAATQHTFQLMVQAQGS